MADHREKPHLGPKYTPDRLAKICRNALRGMSKTDAFRNAGINPDTGFLWLKQGRECTGDPILVRFERVFERCVSRFNAQMADMVTRAATSGAPNTWQAAMTMLERRDPANWGKRDSVKVEVDSPLVQLNQVVLVDDGARELSRALLRRVAGPGTDESLGPGIRGELEAGPDVDSR